MKNQRMWALLTLLTLAPAMTSCWPFRKKKPVVPAPPPPPQQQTAPKAVQFPPPPAIEPAPTEPAIPEEPTEQIPPPPKKKRPSPAGPKVQPTPAPQETETESEPEPQPAAPAPAPSLQPLLTAQQKQELEAAVRTRITSARMSLASIQRRSLSPEQKAAVNQIRVFLDQAEDARKTDLIRANNLAERADVLARDLVGAVR
jgi:outer membrane biosynthesis protein TonB